MLKSIEKGIEYGQGEFLLLWKEQKIYKSSKGKNGKYSSPECIHEQEIKIKDVAVLDKEHILISR